MASAVVFDHVTLRREERTIINDLSWEVTAGQRWAILGPNGSGKTTIMKLAAAQLHPSTGSVTILGNPLGRSDVRELRRFIGLVSGAVTRTLRHDLTAHDIVVTGKDAALEPWWSTYGDEDHARADQLLSDVGMAHLKERHFMHASEGERQHVLLARSLMGAPQLLLLDEPFAGLDLGARERLLNRLDSTFVSSDAPPAALVTHHAEEIPPSVTHAGLLRDGRWVSTGPINDVLNSDTVSECFGLRVEVKNHDGRFSARAI